MIGVSGSGIEDVEGVLEEERDVEGSDAARRVTLSPENFEKPLAWADEARSLEDTCTAASAVRAVQPVAWSDFLRAV